MKKQLLVYKKHNTIKAWVPVPNKLKAPASPASYLWQWPKLF